MLSVAAISAYLVSRGITAPIFHGEDEQEMPDRLVYITPTGGPGEARERTFELITVQARCRGNQNDPADAETLADAVDRAFIDAATPLVIDGRHVTVISWAGGPPAVVGRDDARRYETSASYVVEIAR